MDSLTGLIDSLGGAAGNVLGGLRGKGNGAPAPPPAPSPFAGNAAATGTDKLQAWMPFILGGAGLLLVFLLVARRK